MEFPFYSIRKSFLRNAIFAFVVCGAAPVYAQDAAEGQTEQAAAQRPAKPKPEKYQLMEVKGKVYDAVTKSPLAGVQLQMLGNNRYTAMSEDDGSFTIKVPVFATSLYVFSPEYSSQQVAIGNGKEGIEVYMLSDKFRPMYENGTTITAKRSFSASKSSNLTIDSEIGEMLGGDVRSMQRSASPTVGNSMFVRGINSINANSQPLVIVDGIEMDMQYDAVHLHSGHFNNLLATVNPAEIEKVTVLKNATALYGARGGNGVILIETKRGRSMATRIDADISVGLTLIPTLPTVMNASQYRTYATEMLGTMGRDLSGVSFNFLNDAPPSENYHYYTYHNNTDWTDYTYRNALTQNYTINVQGGDNNGMYNLALGYADAESTAEGNDWDRMNMRFNTDISILKKLRTKFDLALSRSSSKLFDDGVPADFDSSTPTSTTFLSLIKSPLLNPYQYSSVVGGFTGLLSDADEMLAPLGTGFSLANPVGILSEGEGNHKNSATNTNFSVKLEPKFTFNEDVSVTGVFNYTLNRNSQRYMRPGGVVPAFEIQNLGTVYNKFASFFSKENNFVVGLHGDYAHMFGAHSLSATAGFRFNSFSYSSDYPTTEYTYEQDNKVVNHNKDQYFTMRGVNEQWKQIQWYGMVSYNFKQRYFLEAALLGEANSRFGANADGLDMFGVAWGLFPSVQAGWVVTNEKWFPKNAGVDYLRINVGYDMSGNDDIDNNVARTYYSTVKYNNTAIGLLLSNIGNDKVKWETTHKFNVGLQGYFLNNRLGVAFDYFYSKTTDLLTRKSFSSPIGGVNWYWSNGGELQNTGYEATVSFKPVVTKDWNVEVGASVGHYKNEVLALPDGNYTSSIYGEDNILTSVGNPVAVFYGYKTEGVFSTDAEAKAAGKDGNYLYMVDNTGARHNFTAGDVHFVDLNEDGAIDENDRTIIGDPNPDIYGNIFANINWKDFTLSVNFNYSLGNDVYNYQRMVLNSGSNFYNQQVAVTKHWRYEGQVTDMPKLAYGDPMGNNRMSDRWIEDGSYLRLKTLRLTYRIPLHLSWLQGLSVWAEAVNLFTLTNYLGSDPEFSVGNGVMYQGIDAGNLAQSRAFTFGLKINL